MGDDAGNGDASVGGSTPPDCKVAYPGFSGPLRWRKKLRQQSGLRLSRDGRTQHGGSMPGTQPTAAHENVQPPTIGVPVPGGVLGVANGSGLPSSKGSNEAENTTIAAANNSTPPADAAGGGTSGSGSGGELVNAPVTVGTNGSGGSGSGGEGGGLKGSTEVLGVEGTGEGTGGSGGDGVGVGGSISGGGGHSGSGSGNNSAEQISVSKNGKNFGSGDGSGCGSGSVGGESLRTHGHEERNRQTFSSAGLPDFGSNKRDRTNEQDEPAKERPEAATQPNGVDQGAEPPPLPRFELEIDPRPAKKPRPTSSGLDDQPILLRARKHRRDGKTPAEPSEKTSGRESTAAKCRRRTVNANSMANLQRLKACPKCGHTYGNKMGGRPGGSQCTTMVPVVDGNGKLLTNEHGQPVLARCPFVFISSARKKGSQDPVTTQTIEKQEQPQPTDNVGQHGEEQVSSDHSTQDMLLSSKELTEKFGHLMVQMGANKTSEGANMYFALCGMTSSTDVAPSPLLDFAQRKSRHGSRSALLLMRHYAGPVSTIVYDNYPSERPVQANLKDVVSVLPESTSDEDTSNDAGQGSGSDVSGSVSGLSTKMDNIKDLRSLLAAINLEHHYKKLMDHNLDLRGLTSFLDKKPNCAKALSALTGISSGAACKIAQTVLISARRQ